MLLLASSSRTSTLTTIAFREKKSSKSYGKDGNLEPQTTIYKWLFQLDDSKSLHRKWLEITISIHKKTWLFRVRLELNKSRKVDFIGNFASFFPAKSTENGDALNPVETSPPPSNAFFEISAGQRRQPRLTRMGSFRSCDDQDINLLYCKWRTSQFSTQVLLKYIIELGFPRVPPPPLFTTPPLKNPIRR